MDAAARFVRAEGLAAVDRIAEDVEQPPERALAHGHAQSAALARNDHAARKTLALGKHDAAHGLRAQVLRDLHHALLAVKVDSQRLADARQAAAGKAHVYHAAGYLNDLTPAHDAAPPFPHVVFCSARRRRLR